MLSTVTWEAKCKAKSQTLWLKNQSGITFIKPSSLYVYWIPPVRKQGVKGVTEKKMIEEEKMGTQSVIS